MKVRAAQNMGNVKCNPCNTTVRRNYLHLKGALLQFLILAGTIQRLTLKCYCSDSLDTYLYLERHIYFPCSDKVKIVSLDSLKRSPLLHHSGKPFSVPDLVITPLFCPKLFRTTGKITQTLLSS